MHFVQGQEERLLKSILEVSKYLSITDSGCESVNFFVCGKESLALLVKKDFLRHLFPELFHGIQP